MSGVDVRSIIIYEGERLAKPRQFSIKETRCFLKFSFLSERVRFKRKMTSRGYSLYLQQGAGKYKDSEESDFSQESDLSQESEKKAKSLAKKWSLPEKKQKT